MEKYGIQIRYPYGTTEPHFSSTVYQTESGELVDVIATISSKSDAERYCQQFSERYPSWFFRVVKITIPITSCNYWMVS